MNAALRIRLGLGVAFLLAAMSPAAYLESGSGDDTVRAIPPEPPPVVVPPFPEPETALYTLVRRVEVGEPRSLEGLTFYPLRIRGSASQGIRTLDEALRRGELAVREQNAASVPSVVVRNDGRQPVLLLGGEMILGGRQNRMIRNDVLLGPLSEAIEVAVYCAEKERWSGPEPVFKSAGGLTAPTLRRMAARGAAQDHIWQEIDAQLGAAEVTSPTRSYPELYRDPDVDRRVKRCVDTFRRFCRADTVGCVVVSGGRIRGCELFSDAGLFERSWDKICRSYAIDVIVDRRLPLAEGHRHWVPPGHRVAREFLNGVFASAVSAVPTPGVGRRMWVRGQVTGEVLVWRGSVVHASLHSGVMVRPLE